jgi:hypothetical protein
MTHSRHSSLGLMANMVGVQNLIGLFLSKSSELLLLLPRMFRYSSGVPLEPQPDLRRIDPRVFLSDFL